MAYSEDHIALAAEYALGTLDGDERAQVEAMMAVDRNFAAVVEAWQFRLGALNQMVGSVEPRPIVWESIKAVIRDVQPQPSVPVRQAAPPPRNAPARLNEAAEDRSNLVRLRRDRKRWRGVAGAAVAVAAALIALLAVQVYQPEMLPEPLRPKPATRSVEVQTPSGATASAQYVAILQPQGGGLAFILTIDGATKNYTIRKVGAAAPEPGKSYELWLISEKLDRPRSLGVIGDEEFTSRSVLTTYNSDIVDNATYAVTLEQAGGSPDGVPHSAPVYAGKLIEAVPPAPPPAPAQPQKR
jgi:anti-sigma-K factor RskA